MELRRPTGREGDFLALDRRRAPVRPGVLAVPVPLVLCPAGCPEWFASDDGLTLSILNLPDRVGVWVSDDRGQTLTQRNTPSAGPPIPRVLGFGLDGGRRYFLNFVFAPGFSDTDLVRFTVASSVR
jgi:hypothetical protein